MTERTWIVCERLGRWAAALRTAIERTDWRSGRRPRLFEVRQLVELGERLAARPSSLALVEVQAGNFSQALAWLAEAKRSYPNARFAALVARDLRGSRDIASGRSRSAGQLVVDLLREAGADEIVLSPRQLRGMLALDRLHAASAVADANSSPTAMSITAWAWATLPWQDE